MYSNTRLPPAAADDIPAPRHRRAAASTLSADAALQPAPRGQWETHPAQPGSRETPAPAAGSPQEMVSIAARTSTSAPRVEVSNFAPHSAPPAAVRPEARETRTCPLQLALAHSLPTQAVRRP